MRQISLRVPRHARTILKPPSRASTAIDALAELDSNGQALAYVYGHADPRDAGTAKALTLDEARGGSPATWQDLTTRGGKAQKRHLEPL